MNKTNILSDAYRFYFDRAIYALKISDCTMTTKNIIAAAEILLSSAAESTGIVKVKKLKIVRELYGLLNDISKHTNIQDLQKKAFYIYQMNAE